MKTRGLWVACALGLAFAGSAGARDQEGPRTLRTVLKVTVDEAGHPVGVEASQTLADPIRQFVESRARELRFQPVVFDGRPSAGTTYVVMGVCAVERGGDLVLAAEHRSNGPAYVGSSPYAPPPKYPSYAMATRQTAKLTVTYIVERDGSTTLEDIKYAEPRSGSVKRSFDSAMRAWVADLRYLPEQMDGRPVRTRMSTPVEFYLHTSKEAGKRDINEAREASRECIAAESRQFAGQLVTAESPFMLLPDPG